MDEQVVKRFWRKVNKTDSCWLWTASVDGWGYGTFSDKPNGKDRTHRVSWRLHFGEIPSGMRVRIICRNRRCVNPDHLEIRVIKIQRGYQCVEWKGAINDRGYGQVRRDGEVAYVHRIAWTMVNGPIPDGLNVLHHCDNPPCYNVDHLFLGTQADNMIDMVTKGRAGWQRKRAAAQ